MWIGSEIVAHVNLGCVCVEESGRECESMVESVSANCECACECGCDCESGSLRKESLSHTYIHAHSLSETLTFNRRNRFSSKILFNNMASS